MGKALLRDRWWRWQQKYAPYLFVSPFLILFAVFMLYPMGRSLMLSFYRTAGQSHVFVGLGNYRYLLGHDLLFFLAVANTTLFAVSFLVIQVPASLGLALLLNMRGIRFGNLFRFSFFCSYLVGQVFVGVIFGELFKGWLNNPKWVMPTIVIAALWLSIGLGMIYFLAALQGVDQELYEAAAVDGAGKGRAFWHVTLPGIRPVLVYVILIGGIGAFQLFELPYVLLQGGGPNLRGMTIVMYLFSMGFDTGDLGYASAIGWVLVLILLLLSVAQLRLTRATAEVSA